MKRIYYLVFNALPTSGNPDAERLEGGLAHFWVEDRSPELAMQRAKHYISRYEWAFKSPAQDPVETVLADYNETDFSPDVVNYLQAKRAGVSLHLVAWAKPGLMPPGTYEMRRLRQAGLSA